MILKYFFLLLLLLFSREINGATEGDIRLVGGYPYEGRIEIFHSGSWGTVCDDRFDFNDGEVICRQLGFDGVERVLHSGHSYGQGTGEIWMDGLQCTGRESKLASCHFNGFGRHDCHHIEDAAVICKHHGIVQPSPTPSPSPSSSPTTRPSTSTTSNPTPSPTNRPPPAPDSSVDKTVRIVCPSSFGMCDVCTSGTGCPDHTNDYRVIGVVERYINNEWHPIPLKDWNFNAANVVCGQLGYPVAGPIPKINVIFPLRYCNNAQNRNTARCNALRALRTRFSTPYTRGVVCKGSEDKIENCYHYDASYTTSPNSSPFRNVATISCRKDEQRSEHCGRTNSPELYRLRGGPVPWRGRVEVRRNGKWGTICDLGWDLSDANVVCRNLGYGTAKKVFTRAHFGRGSSETHFSNLRCKGNETLLSRCLRTSDTALAREVLSYCNQHSGDAGVECNIPSCRIEQESRFTNGHLEVKGRNGWGRLCFGAIDYDDAHVICRETLEQFPARFISVSDSSYSGNVYSGVYNCTGDEIYLSECTKRLVLNNSCNTHTKLDCTTGLPDLVPNVARFEQSLKYYPYLDRIPLFYLACAKEEGCLSSSANGITNAAALRLLLRFDSLTMNYGTVDFLPNLEPHEWQWHQCHQHYHSFEAFINYDILDLSRNKVADGHKASFCLEDSLCDYGAAANRYRCSTGIQGIGVNCGDLYGRHLDCQWIDVTGIKDGTFIVRQIVNKDHHVAESCYKNNIIECKITLDQLGRISNVSCGHSDH
jgi:lysyl oxidase-like protein 2/3/4